MRGGSKTRSGARLHLRHHWARRLKLAIILLVLFATILLILSAVRATLFEYSDPSPPEEAEQSRSTEQSQPEPVSETSSERVLDEAWATAVTEDPSPSLAAPGETLEFGRKIALTFDDGPDPITTPAILDILRAYGLKSTFFIYGARAERHPDLIKRIVSEGHTLGNHTYYHRNMTKLTPDLILKELQDTQAVVDQVLGSHSRMTLFRPPCGTSYNAEADKLPVFQKIMREQKIYPVMWNVDSRDWTLEGYPEGIVDVIARSTPEDGGVILLHDTQPQTVDGLPGILDYYLVADFEFTDVRNLLAEKYGVDREGIQPDLDPFQDRAIPLPDGPGEGVPEDISSLADCLTH